MILTNYTLMLYRRPPSGVPLLLARKNWMNPVVVNSLEAIHPETNSSGLHWALTGIAREMLGEWK